MNIIWDTVTDFHLSDHAISLAVSSYHVLAQTLIVCNVKYYYFIECYKLESSQLYTLTILDLDSSGTATVIIKVEEQATTQSLAVKVDQ